MSKIIYLIRHGQIRSNVLGVYAGRSAESLTQEGEKRAAQLGKEIQRWGISVIYVSPLKRTQQTAAILNRYLKARLVAEPDLMEIELGHWTGLSKDELWRRYPSEYIMWMQSPGEFQQEGIESLGNVRQRVLRVVNKILIQNPDETSGVVTHAVVIKVAVLHFNHLPLNSYHGIDVPNLSVYKLAFGEGGGRIERVR